MGRATVFATLALLLCAAGAARAELRVLTPPDGARLTASPVTLIGSGATAALEVTVNGRAVSGAKQIGKAFTVELALTAGENVVVVKSGVESRRLVYAHDEKAGAEGAFRYHPPVDEGDCKACHPQGVGRTFPVTEAKLCNTCHDPKTAAKVLHGPLGAGQCSICHDPHGSSYPAFLVTGTRALCAQCHAQSRSQSHIQRAENKNCPECHDPHGSGKQYLLH